MLRSDLGGSIGCIVSPLDSEGEKNIGVVPAEIRSASGSAEGRGHTYRELRHGIQCGEHDSANGAQKGGGCDAVCLGAGGSGLACVNEDERPGDDIVSCEDRVSAGSGWRRRAHLDRLRKGPDRVLAEKDTHAVPEGKFECIGDGGGGYTEGGRDGVGASSAKEGEDGLGTACRAEILLLRIRNGSSEQQRAYQGSERGLGIWRRDTGGEESEQRAPSGKRH